MDSRVRRRMTEYEKRALEDNLGSLMGDRQSTFRMLDRISSVPGMILSGLILLVLFGLNGALSSPSPGEGFIRGTETGSLVTLVFMALMSVIRRPIRLFCQMLDEIRADLASGDVNMQEIQARAVVLVLPFEKGDPPGHLFEIGDGKLLFLDGTDSMILGKGATFPSDRFEIVEGTVSQTCIGVVPTGQPLVPMRSLGPLSAKEATALGQRDRFFPGRLDQIEAVLHDPGESDASP